jgi:hypothetical protein
VLGTEEDNGASDGAVVGVGEEGCQAFDDVARDGHMPVAAFVVCGREVGVSYLSDGQAKKHLQALILVTFIGAALVASAASVAQNLGTAPATGQAVQGQTASQPEGAFLNLVNWVCNVICSVGAGIAVVATVLQWRSGRSWLPSAMTAGGLICVSGILRLIEYFISQGQAVG